MRYESVKNEWQKSTQWLNPLLSIWPWQVESSINPQSRTSKEMRDFPDFAQYSFTSASTVSSSEIHCNWWSMASVHKALCHSHLSPGLLVSSLLCPDLTVYIVNERWNTSSNQFSKCDFKKALFKHHWLMCNWSTFYLPSLHQIQRSCWLMRWGHAAH